MPRVSLPQATVDHVRHSGRVAMRNLILLATLLLASCSTQEAVKPGVSTRGRMSTPDADVVARLDSALAEHRIVTAGFGILRNGELVWSHYYGDETPGVAASASTRFNVASITKSVVA